MAEQAFYSAFERADIRAMMSVWAKEDSVVCIHPGGSRIEGYDNIEESWREIFSGESRLKFRLTESLYTQNAMLAVRQVKENIIVEGKFRGIMLATNIYQLIDDSWQLLLHHASPEPQAMTELNEDTTLH